MRIRDFVKSLTTEKEVDHHTSSFFTLPSSLSPAFTLVELLVVVGMLAVLMAALTTSVTAARHRARVQKATSDVKVISQTILAYENYSTSHTLPTMTKKEATKKNLSFLFGTGDSMGGSKLPTLLEASLSTSGEILDPWGHPYVVSITPKTATMYIKTATQDLKAGYSLSNWYRISEDER